MRAMTPDVEDDRRFLAGAVAAGVSFDPFHGSMSVDLTTPYLARWVADALDLRVKIRATKGKPTRWGFVLRGATARDAAIRMLDHWAWVPELKDMVLEFLGDPDGPEELLLAHHGVRTLSLLGD